MARSSEAAKARRRAKNASNGGKPGNPGEFQGRRAEVINDALPEYLTLKGQDRRVHAAFWAFFFARWWAMFHWSIPLDQEVPLPDPEADVAMTESRALSPEIEDEELMLKKGAIIKKTQEVRSIRSIFCAVPYTDVAHAAT